MKRIAIITYLTFGLLLAGISEAPAGGADFIIQTPTGTVYGYAERDGSFRTHQPGAEGINNSYGQFYGDRAIVRQPGEWSPNTYPVYDPTTGGTRMKEAFR